MSGDLYQIDDAPMGNIQQTLSKMADYLYFLLGVSQPPRKILRSYELSFESIICNVFIPSRLQAKFSSPLENDNLGIWVYGLWTSFKTTVISLFS